MTATALGELKDALVELVGVGLAIPAARQLLGRFSGRERLDVELATDRRSVVGYGEEVADRLHVDRGIGYLRARVRCRDRDERDSQGRQRRSVDTDLDVILIVGVPTAVRFLEQVVPARKRPASSK